MKNLLVSLSLFAVLVVFGLFVFKQTTGAQNSLTADLLDLPAPPPANPLIENIGRKRPENFYDKNSSPKDDAPIEDLLDYWTSQNSSYRELGYNIRPSDRALERILDAVEKKPEMLVDFLNILPEKQEVADFVKRIYDLRLSNQSSQGDENYRLTEIKKWLIYKSDYFSDELFRQAQKSSETAEYVTNQEEVLALARVDWNRAEPLLEKMLGNDKEPASKTLAQWAFYRHALAKDDAADIEKYRDQLKAVVGDKNASAGMRDLAIDALVKEKEWQGFEDWYISLLSDETLYDLKINGQSYTGLTTPMYYAPPDKYTAKMLELIKSDNPTVRSAAVRNLTTSLDEKNPEVVRALLPWLENPEWATDSNNARRVLISALGAFTMPESVPGLIAVLNEKIAGQSLPQTNNMSNSTLSNGRMSNAAPSYNYNASPVAETVNHPYRSEAIAALTRQKDVRAVSSLRIILPQVEPFERPLVVGALLASGGFSVGEQIEALELTAKNTGRQNNGDSAADLAGDAGTMRPPPAPGYPPDAVSERRIITNADVDVNSMSNTGYSRLYNPSELKVILGSQLAAATEVGDELVASLVDRINYLDARDAGLAVALRKIMLNWQGAAVNSLLLRDLRKGKAEAVAVVKLLSLRKDLREKQSSEVFDIRGGNASALGISACLLEDNSEYDALLEGGDAEVKSAMFACARLIRARLPVSKVAEYLQNPNTTLALAAERYLESEDSPEARRAVLAKHRGEAKILGATTYFAANDKPINSEGNFLAELFTSVTDSMDLAPYYYLYDDSGELKSVEKRLQREVKENEPLLGIYAYDGNFIRIYKDKADFSWEEDSARYRERALTEAEFDQFKNYLAVNKADELPPFISVCGEEGCKSKELLMLGREGGRRVFFKGDEAATFFKELAAMFDEMRKPPAKLRYRLEENIANLSILFADDVLQARAVWKNGEDFRVLIEDTQRARQIEDELNKRFQADEGKIGEENTNYEKIEEERRKRAEQREFEGLAWHKIEKGKLDGAAAQPPQIEYIPPRDAYPIKATILRWKARTANLEIRTNEDGLYKISRGQISRVQSGYYTNPLITPDGQWALATKYFDEGNAIVRINLTSRKEFKVKLDGYPNYEAVAIVPSINRVLIFANSYEPENESREINSKKGAYFLLDAQTGIVQPVKSEIRPLAQQTFRPLQPATNPDEFWAAIPDTEKNETLVGIYNQKTFVFKSLMKIPQIQFDSMDVWADERENKIYFVYEGHLLGLPLPKR